MFRDYTTKTLLYERGVWGLASATEATFYVQVSPNDEDLREDASNRTSDSFLMPLFMY